MSLNKGAAATAAYFTLLKSPTARCNRPGFYFKLMGSASESESEESSLSTIPDESDSLLEESIYRYKLITEQ